MMLMGCKSYDDGDLWNKVNELDGRLSKVEAALSQMNGNITSLQTIVNAVQNNVYITEVKQTATGYIIVFSDGTKATILNGENGLTPRIGDNGNWWIGTTDTGVQAEGKDGKDGKDGEDGKTPYIGDNGNWWIDNTDTGKPAIGKDGLTPFIGANGNWWIGTTDTGVKAQGSDGLTPHIGNNGNWWIGTTDTGVKAEGKDGKDGHDGQSGQGEGGSSEGTVDFPIIGVDIYEGAYYWTVTVDGETTWLLDLSGEMIPVSGYRPIFKVDYTGYIVYSYDGGITWLNIYDEYGYPLIASSGCSCTQFFLNVYVQGDYLYLILIDGTVVKIRITDGERDRGDIPEDPTTPTPDPGEPTVPIPYPNILPTVDEWGNHVVTINFTGIQDPNTGEWLTLHGTGLSEQNVWVEVDGSPKGILVINLEDNTTMVKNDIVFTVDNSVSMSEEANAIARDIISWAQMLTNNNLDVKFGVVGFGGYVDGAMNLTDASSLSSYLNTGSGTSRTMHFGGPDANTLQSYANSYPRTGGSTGSNECGAMAIRFANDYFSFRANANRIYVNFTDEGNQPNNISGYSVEWFKSQSNWPTSNGTVHTVFSDFQSSVNGEKPWLISEYTGGTTMFVKSDASDLQLDKLKVSDALTHAYTIKFIVPDSLFDGMTHIVRIVVISSDGSVRGVLEIPVVFGIL